MSGVRFDPRPLIEPVDPRAVEQEVRLIGEVPFSRAPGLLAGGVISLAAPLLFLPLLAVPIALPAFWPVALLVFIPILVLFVWLGVWMVVASGRQLRAQRESRYRMIRFAAANAMQYIPSIPQPPLPGSQFRPGGDKHAADVLRGRSPRFVEVGNLRITRSNGKNSYIETSGYVAIEVHNLLPHIMLDARRNGPGVGTEGAQPDKHQRLSLEGDFDEHFTLSCPRGYERDALYLFTPDIMQRLVVQAAVLDVELVDNWVFFYSARPLSTLDPSMWAWLFSLVNAMLAKLEQWERWRDDRLLPAPWHQPVVAALPAAAPASGQPVPGLAQSAWQVPAPAPQVSPEVVAPPAMPWAPPIGVAPPGRRLRRSGNWGCLVGGIFAVAAVVLVPVFVVLGALLAPR